MCGIVGSWCAPRWDVARAAESLAHRGPDGRGFRAIGDAIHGHVRLALVDLTDASAQPFERGDGTLSFVGEIWNHAELREQLIATGSTFRTTGDTEVLAAVMERMGAAGLDLLDGMFAFAWSTATRTILVRDRFGKVPLYVQRDPGGAVYWASERRALPCPGAGVALPPGHVWDLWKDAPEAWYALPRVVVDEDPAALVLGALRSGVRKRLAADAPVAVLCSGGLDSALITALAREERDDVTAFHAYVDDKSPDLAAARRLCADLSVRLVEVPVQPPTRESLRVAVAAIEIPMKAQVEIATLCVPLARAIRAEGFKACLSGEAADELFGGYGNMMIRAARSDDQGWRDIRTYQLAKMARGNFVRCNKSFMAGGVECRLPFMERRIVEAVLSMTKAQCPPGKTLLKQVAAGVLPRWVTTRRKETFQGASGVSAMAARVVEHPVRYYNECARDGFRMIPSC